MYINKQKLAHLLQPEHYRSEEFYEVEKSTVFSSSWHLVGAVGEIPNDGDFMTHHIIGHPLLVKNYNGEIVIFLNVCGHRHCRLTDEKSGNSPTIRCQYHGWQYQKNGFTGKIPDAQCFKPFDRENTRLQIYRSHVCGGLIFVALNEDAPDFDEYAGKFKPVLEEWFGSSRFHFGMRMTFELKTNWKVSNENTLESYHVPHVHKKTIGDHPEEEEQEHEIGERSSSLFTIEPDTMNRRFQDVLLKLIGVDYDRSYTHHMIYPNTIMLALDAMTMTQTYIPTSRNTHRWEGMVFCRTAARGRKIFQQLSDSLVKLSIQRVVKEDIHMFEEIQAGLEYSGHPGVLGTIEERVFAFQEYLLEKCEGREKDSSVWDGPLVSHEG